MQLQFGIVKLSELEEFKMNFHTKPVTYPNHVHLYVEDLKRSVEFYKKIVGFKELETTSTKAVLTADGKTPLLTVEQPFGVIPKEPRRSGLYHMAILLPSREELGKFLYHLIINGVRPGSADHAVSEALYFNDPDGNGIEVYRDREPEEWTWNGDYVHMVTEYLDAQGVLDAGAGKPWGGLPVDTVMGHIHLHVSDEGAAKEFYTKGLGFEVVAKLPQAYFFGSHKYHHHIAANTWNGVGAPAKSVNSAGLHSFSLVYADKEALENTVASLKELGAPVEQINDSYMTKDPAGNRIILTI